MPIAAIMLCGCSAAENGGSPAAAKRAAGLDPKAAERAYANCHGASELAGAIDVSWSTQVSRLSEHRAFRESMKVPLPEGNSRILFWSSGAHHTMVSSSVVAVRDASGKWHTSGIGETTSMLAGVEPNRMTLERDLSPDEGRVLDQLLGDPCLYASPTFQRNPNIVAGGAEQTMEIETPKQRWISSWFGRLTPQQAGVINQITR
ncbi:hypothetical protein SPMU_13190 [Sphingomonas mucosissima]|uniref:Uncharacterized protein n=2 Tax=Sphingomonas mucosissima TaxID=370959 RepID=A0A245ZT91_9SPHN|nr:hypothetical protein SPMU_13190 [Sphingomonas mucosissima]